MKYLIVGLGNIGEEYRNTRHNAGFKILDALAEASNISLSTARYGDVGTGRIKNRLVVLLKPSTYMNLSGIAVKYWKDKEDIDIKNILILVDDISLPFGAIRIRPGGSDAGHNGLKSIAEMLGTNNYARLRFGVGHDFLRGCQIDYVLGNFTPDQQKEMPARLKLAVVAIRKFVLEGCQKAMCAFNGAEPVLTNKERELAGLPPKEEPEDGKKFCSQPATANDTKATSAESSDAK